ncbi:MAG: VWA domain-containing protein [Pseudomonadota bacterium]
MSAAERWYHASLAGAFGLIAGVKTGGIRLMSGAGPVRDIWLNEFNELIPSATQPVYVPASVSARRLTGGVSMARSLASGQLAYEKGLIAEAAGRVLVINMADRLETETAALIAAEIDRSDPDVHSPACTLLLDESESTEDAPPAVLIERIGFTIDLSAIPLRTAEPFAIRKEDISDAQNLFPNVDIAPELIDAIVAACASIGVQSMRLPMFCANGAKASAALDGRTAVSEEDVLLACRLVLPSRTDMPESPPPPAPEDPLPDDGQKDTNEAQDDSKDAQASAEDLETMLIDAITADAGATLARRQKARADRKSGRRKSIGMAGRSGDSIFAMDKGRPDRTSQRRTDQGRVDLIATLRNAAPMQSIRRSKRDDGRMAIRRSDLRMKRFRRRQQSSVIFVVDASGSSALNRLSEAKGAATQLLSDCYARRDLVSVIAFRGTDAELVLPPTRSLVRARRQLSDLPAGGATPLADAVALASNLADAERERGRTPVIVFLSDGRGNMSLDGTANRTIAEQETKLLARQLAQTGNEVLFFDTSKRPDPRAQSLCDDMSAQYYFLPVADRSKVSGIVRDQIGWR